MLALSLYLLTHLLLPHLRGWILWSIVERHTLFGEGSAASPVLHVQWCQNTMAPKHPAHLSPSGPSACPPHPQGVGHDHTSSTSAMSVAIASCAGLHEESGPAQSSRFEDPPGHRLTTTAPRTTAPPPAWPHRAHWHIMRAPGAERALRNTIAGSSWRDTVYADEPGPAAPLRQHAGAPTQGQGHAAPRARSCHGERRPCPEPLVGPCRQCSSSCSTCSHWCATAWHSASRRFGNAVPEIAASPASPWPVEPCCLIRCTS